LKKDVALNDNDREAFEAASNKLRIYAISRGDLEMSPGKLSAQTGHAFANCAITALAEDPELLRVYQGPDFIGTKVSLTAKSEGALLYAYEQARAAGLIACLITDKNHIIPGTSFDGNEIITALGIGPCTREQAHHITKKFQTVK
jgi:peptidyl-tRNA hydrolase